jgi:2,5-diketo-D-gluconate reductase A
LKPEISPALGKVTLLDGRQMPPIGFGTYPLKGADAVATVSNAIDAGYRLIDTAVHYENEREVGEAVRRADVPREQLFLCSKLPGRHHVYDDAIASTRMSLQTMGLDYLDMHLIHWPNPHLDRYVEAWRALVALQQDGLIRSIGVSNFTREHLERIISATGVTPAVNQIEMHPMLPQTDLRALHDELGVTTVAWSPLGRGSVALQAPAIAAAAQRCEVALAQVVLRWHVELGAIPVPKSANTDRQRQNLDVFDFELTADEIAAISAFAQADGRMGGDPDLHVEL